MLRSRIIELNKEVADLRKKLKHYSKRNIINRSSCVRATLRVSIQDRLYAIVEEVLDTDITDYVRQCKEAADSEISAWQRLTGCLENKEYINDLAKAFTEAWNPYSRSLKAPR